MIIFIVQIFFQNKYSFFSFWVFFEIKIGYSTTNNFRNTFRIIIDIVKQNGSM